jgi:hypothetical protein
MRLLTGLLIFLTLTTYGQTIKRSDWKVIPNNLDESVLTPYKLDRIVF